MFYYVHNSHPAVWTSGIAEEGLPAVCRHPDLPVTVWVANVSVKIAAKVCAADIKVARADCLVDAFHRVVGKVGPEKVSGVAIEVAACVASVRVAKEPRGAVLTEDELKRKFTVKHCFLVLHSL